MTRSLILFAFSWTALAGPAVDAYISQVNGLISAHQQGISRLAQPAAATADALMAGGRFYLNHTDNGAWFYEGIGRAGGLMQTDEYTSATKLRSGDVVWISYTPSTFTNAMNVSSELTAQKVVVVALGPRSPDGPPAFPNWVESFTPWEAEDRFTIMANVISLWTLEGELASATARRGRTLVLWQGIAVPGATNRNGHYSDQQFHDGFPQMQALPAGSLSGDYLDTIADMIGEIIASELPQITDAARIMAQRSAAGNPPTFVVNSHVLYFIGLENIPYFRFLPDPSMLDKALAETGYLIELGYSGVDLEHWRTVRLAGAQATWITGELPNQNDFSGRGDNFISEHWQLGDASVEAPGYDVRLLPVSGVAQIFILDLLLKAASEA